MADNNFRSHPNRAAAPPSRAQQDDPLAELARLIGQSEPAADIRRDARRGTLPSYDEPSLDWPAQDGEGAAQDYPDDRYAAPAAPEHGDAAYDDYEQQPLGDAFESHRPGGQVYDDDAGGAESGRQGSALSTRLNGGRDFARDYYVPPEQARFREVGDTHAVADRQAPGFLSEARVDRYQFDDEAADDQAYDEYQEDELPAGRRRRGIVVVAAVLGLAILGTAGAFAYRAMFGSSMLPALPPIIKADDGPNKIIPAKPKSNTDQADASDAGSGEKLVSREEQPVDMPAPANSTPRVVSTIPIFPDPNSGQAGVPDSAQAGMSAGGQNVPALNAAAPMPAPPPPMVTSTPPAQANSIWPPAPPVASSPVTSSAAGAAPAAAAPAPRKVHTVVIHSDQLGAETADASPAPPPLPAPAAAPIRTASPRPAMAPPPRPAAARLDANAPLSIVPNEAGEAPPAAAPGLRTALARPNEAPAAARAEPAATASGGYAVQVTSQRSEAAAQAEFRALKGKFPNQLGSREPLIRRADLGAKGVYYRALVGPFASAEEATAMCSGLKSAGGSCIVQRN